jgi:polysaccharide export outer membrane protein
MLKKMFVSVLGLLILVSCASKKDVLYYQNIDSIALNATSYESVLQPDDILTIIVRGENAQSVVPFNSPNISYSGIDGTGLEIQRVFTYLIDSNNNINFPSLGNVSIGGLSKIAAEELLNKKLSKYVINPSVNIRILNFKISVQGEVSKPGTYAINSERVTILEAISLAGDLTVYGKRDNVLIIREENGEKKIFRIDLKSADFINSPSYYLHQNDVVYIEPNKTKINGAAVGPNTGIILTGISLLITVLALTIR